LSPSTVLAMVSHPMKALWCSPDECSLDHIISARLSSCKSLCPAHITPPSMQELFELLDFLPQGRRRIVRPGPPLKLPGSLLVCIHVCIGERACQLSAWRRHSMRQTLLSAAVGSPLIPLEASMPPPTVAPRRNMAVTTTPPSSIPSAAISNQPFRAPGALALPHLALTSFRGSWAIPELPNSFLDSITPQAVCAVQPAEAVHDTAFLHRRARSIGSRVAC